MKIAFLYQNPRGFVFTVFLVALTAVAGFTGAQRCEAQVLYGSIVGNVLDPSQAAVPEATVTITHTDTGQSRTTTTSATGAYSFPTLPSGAYDIRVTKEGFQSYSRSGVNVSINAVTRVDVTLVSRLGHGIDTGDRRGGGTTNGPLRGPRRDRGAHAGEPAGPARAKLPATPAHDPGLQSAAQRPLGAFEPVAFAPVRGQRDRRGIEQRAHGRGHPVQHLAASYHRLRAGAGVHRDGGRSDEQFRRRARAGWRGGHQRPDQERHQRRSRLGV